MEKLNTLLIAHRGEIAVRIIRTAKALGIKTISVYTPSDITSQHVRDAEEAVPLPRGPDGSTSYRDVAAILSVAKEKHVDAIIPGYGPLSENSDFVRAVIDAGLQWVGPSANAIQAFALKHVTRDIAEKMNVPIMPGTADLMKDEDAASKAAAEIGYPVVLKATGGKRGRGLQICKDEQDLKQKFLALTETAQQLFKNPGIFIEKYYPDSRHIEVQVFGNGQGAAVHFGERECSLQRQHQKVVEECPSPFVARYEGLRDAIGQASAKLLASVNYASVGSVEYLLDDKTGGCYFLGANTRLQVEHGVTEMCYGIDLVELMLKQADAQLAGKGGVDAKYLESLQNDHSEPKGSAIECRIYAENPLRDYTPSTGILQEVKWAVNDSKSTRIDTWVERGSIISSDYNHLIGKVMHHSPHSRADAIDGMQLILQGTKIYGPQTNLDFLTAIIANPDFASGQTLTGFLDALAFAPPAIEVISAGTDTIIVDHPGRPYFGNGIPTSGAMDPTAFQVANILVGNPRGKEGLEIVSEGPELHFIKPAIISVCGAPMECTKGSESFAMWKRIHVKAGQKVKIGRLTGGGYRAYLAVHGGFTNIAEYLGSKSTSAVVGIGGYQGRALVAGDLISVTEEIPDSLMKACEIPKSLIPTYTDSWEVLAMPGPHEDSHLFPEDAELIYSTKWQVSENTDRNEIRLKGPQIKYWRKNGTESNFEPLNIVEYGYPPGGLVWSEEGPWFASVDSPNLGKQLSSTTVIRADWSKLGQLKPGDKIWCRRVSFEEAVVARKMVISYINGIEEAAQGKQSFESISPLDTLSVAKSSTKEEWGSSIIDVLPASGSQPLVKYLQAGDSQIIIEYDKGDQSSDLAHHYRVVVLAKLLSDESQTPKEIRNALGAKTSCCRSLNVTFNPLALQRTTLISHLKILETKLDEPSTMAKTTIRRFHLPITFGPQAHESADIRRGLTQGMFSVVAVGGHNGSAIAIPVDPQYLINTTPSSSKDKRIQSFAGGVTLQRGRVLISGGIKSLHRNETNVQMTMQTVPIFDAFGWREGFDPTHPWLLEVGDAISFYDVEEAKMEKILEAFEARKYIFEMEKVDLDLASGR